MGAIEALDARHASQREAQERADQQLNESVNRAREASLSEYAESEQGAVREQQVEAERVMRLPTPKALKEIGSVVPKDVTRFPSE